MFQRKFWIGIVGALALSAGMAFGVACEDDDADGIGDIRETPQEQFDDAFDGDAPGDTAP